MDKQSIENNLNNEQELPKYWIDIRGRGSKDVQKSAKIR